MEVQYWFLVSKLKSILFVMTLDHELMLIIGGLSSVVGVVKVNSGKPYVFERWPVDIVKDVSDNVCYILDPFH